MGWKQGPTTIFVDNNTMSGIFNSTIKRERSRAMNGQYFWLTDQVNSNTYRIKWAPGIENMADYFTKHFAATHHRDVRPFLCANGKFSAVNTEGKQKSVRLKSV